MSRTDFAAVGTTVTPDWTTLTTLAQVEILPLSSVRFQLSNDAGSAGDVDNIRVQARSHTSGAWYDLVGGDSGKAFATIQQTGDTAFPVTRAGHTAHVLAEFPVVYNLRIQARTREGSATVDLYGFAETDEEPERDLRTEVQLGRVPGWSTVKAMGEYENSGNDAGGEDVCRGQDFTPDGPTRLYTPASGGEQVAVISESGNDASEGTGVQTLRLLYLDSTGAEQTEDVTLNGTNVVNTTATDIRFVNDVFAVAVGSGAVAAGNIGIYKTGDTIPNTLHQMIGAGGNKSLVPHRMVPLGKTLLLQEWHCTEAQGKRAAFRIRSTDMNGVLLPGIFCFKGVAYLKNDVSSPQPLEAAVPALSIVKVSVWPDQVGSEGSCSWWGYLVDD